MSVSVETIEPISDPHLPAQAPPKQVVAEDGNGYAGGWFRRLPAFLISTIAHTALLLLLALWTLRGKVGPEVGLQFEATWAREPASDAMPLDVFLATGDSAPASAAAPSPDDAPESISNALSHEASIARLLDAPSLFRESASSETELDRLLRATANNTSVSFADSGVDGRKPTARRELALTRGGSIESEQAVERALAWLAAHQFPNGSWSLVHDTDQCHGQCANIGSRGRFDPAATGLALLAFLGAGYTHKEGKYQREVNAGIYYLLQIQHGTPQGGSFLHECDRGMYNHGIAAFALCEAFQMTGDEDLRKAAQAAISFIANAQNQAGGWGYLPKKPGDLTISGWQVMALKSASAAGLYVRPDVIARIDKFLDSQTTSEAIFYGYTRPDRKSSTCTAIGLLLRLFRNWSLTDPRVLQGVDYLFRLGVSKQDAYYNYYVTLLLFHCGGATWPAWNSRMRDPLVQTQRTTGHEAGSWYFENEYGKEGGRLYTTAMCAMTLEVYYRFAPLYRQAGEDFQW